MSLLLFYWSPDTALIQYGSLVHKRVGLKANKTIVILGIQIKLTERWSSGTTGEIREAGSERVDQYDKTPLNLGTEGSKVCDCGYRP